MSKTYEVTLTIVDNDKSGRSTNRARQDLLRTIATDEVSQALTNRLGFDHVSTRISLIIPD